jgi:hypothetical protein
MPDDGFGADLWKNLQGIKLGHDGGIEVPVRANDRDGVVVGLNAVAAADAAAGATAAKEDATGLPESRPKRRWLARLLRH